MTIYRLLNGEPYAVEIRPGSTVTGNLLPGGAYLVVEISHPQKITITQFIPVDVAKILSVVLNSENPVVAKHLGDQS